jgi:hypothetical protein
MGTQMDLAGKNIAKSSNLNSHIRVFTIGLPSAYYYGYYYPQPMVGYGIPS